LTEGNRSCPRAIGAAGQALSLKVNTRSQNRSAPLVTRPILHTGKLDPLLAPEIGVRVVRIGPEALLADECNADTNLSAYT
jgi:hypothetical protein